MSSGFRKGTMKVSNALLALPLLLTQCLVNAEELSADRINGTEIESSKIQSYNKSEARKDHDAAAAYNEKYIHPVKAMGVLCRILTKKNWIYNLYQETI